MGAFAWRLLALTGPLVALIAADGSSVLTQHLGFKADDMKKIERGEVVAHSLPTDGTEVAIAAAGTVNVPVSFYLERFEKIEAFKRSEEVLQIGRFSAPPTTDDLRTLTLDEGDIDALRACRVGKCDVKLDAAGIERVRTGNILEAFREYLAEYATKYLREGNAALMEYQDGKKRALLDGLRAIAKRSPYLQQDWPAMGTAVREFNGTLPQGLRHFLYWSKEKPPGKAIVTLTHAVIRPEQDGVALVATKQLYASHYMTASLGLTVLVKRDTAAGPQTLVIYINRTHVDLFDGILGAVKRPIVRSRARGTAERSLARLRTRLQTEWSARGASK